MHDIGIFTNVFKDHINYENIKSQDDIYTAKSFVFHRLQSKGKYIASLDNDYTLKSFSESVLTDSQAVKIGITQRIVNQEELQNIQKN